MRYSTVETVYAIGRFPSAGTVTIQLWNPATGSPVAVTSSSCSEMGGSGLYTWPSSSLQTQPTSLITLVYTMVDALNNRYDGKIVIGGYVDTLPDSVWDNVKSLSLVKWLGYRG